VASSCGGGASGGALNYCTLTGNSAGDGGGANNSALNNCMLTGNSAAWSGGATWGGRLTNCTLTGNSSAIWWGGAGGGSLNNCIIYSNSAPNGPNYSDDSSATLNYCCTTPPPATPLPPWWRTGNITNAPLFVDYAGGNLRLQSNSPCINAGNNAYATGSTDLAGNPRNVSGTVDIGAYEFQGTGSTISYAWLQQFGLPTDGSADAADLDGDGHSTWQEWRCQTCPTNTMSSLRLLTAAPTGNNLTVTWQSVAGVNYFLERSTNLASNPSFTRLATSIPGKAGTTTYTDTNTAALTQRFYRVGVQP
jgi:hypothetical protein